MQVMTFRTRGRSALWFTGVALVAGAALLFLALRSWRPGGPAGSAGHAQPAQHEHDHTAQPVSVYEGRFEAFFELPPLVVGEAVDVAIHLSDATVGEPLAATSVELALERQGATRVLRTNAKAAGIYVVRVVFAEPGTYAARLDISERGDRHTLALPEFKVFATESEAERALEGTASSPAKLAFSKEQQWRLRTLTQPAVRRAMVERLIVPGKVIAAPGAEAVVTPPAPGTLMAAAEKPFPRVGDQVQAGQLLATLEPSAVGGSAVQLMANRAQLETLDAELSVKETQVATQVRAAEQEVAFAEKALERMKTLAASGTAAARAQFEAQLALDLAQIRRQGAIEQLKPYTEARARLATLLQPQAGDSTGVERANLRVPLVSPIRGTLVNAHATAGEFLNQGETVFQIIDMTTVWIEARVSEYDLARVERAPAASYRLSAYPDEVVPILGAGGGQLVDVGVVVDEANRTVPVRYQLPNHDRRLRIGMFAEVLVETQRSAEALAIPAAALVDDSGEPTVFVQHSGETFEKRPVRTGLRDGDFVEILEGLSSEERVVVQGAFALRLTSMSPTMPAHGHEH